MAPVAPAQYPAVAEARVDWSKTFCVDAKAAYDDFSRATHQCEFKFLIMADEDDPEIAHNEIASALLGIHQVAPMQAVALHYLDMIVGRANLDDYLNYANSHLDQPQQMAAMLAFGTFVTEEGKRSGPGQRVWNISARQICFSRPRPEMRRKRFSPYSASGISSSTGDASLPAKP